LLNNTFVIELKNKIEIKDNKINNLEEKINDMLKSMNKANVKLDDTLDELNDIKEDNRELLSGIKSNMLPKN